MSGPDLEDLVQDIPSLRGVFVTVMPDCLLFDSWVRGDNQWVAEEVATYFGDLVRANRQGLKALRAWSSGMQITIESVDLLLVLREVREGNFVLGIAFDRTTPLGMVRLHCKSIEERLDAQLPTFEAAERPRGLRVMEFLERYAPDPFTVRQRVALKTGVSVQILAEPEHLEGEQLERVETAVKDILGLDELRI